MLRRAGATVTLAKTPDAVQSASRVILPGVGAYDDCATALQSVDGLKDSILDYAKSGRLLLGICVGMQLLGQSSEEGRCAGLNIIPGRVRRFSFNRGDASQASLKVPHMGWSSVQTKRNSPLYVNGLSEVNRFYFVHSYYYEPANFDHVAATCHYGFEFAAALQMGNVHGAQFHPEKSHRFGLQLFSNFLEAGE